MARSTWALLGSAHDARGHGFAGFNACSTVLLFTEPRRREPIRRRLGKRDVLVLRRRRLAADLCRHLSRTTNRLCGGRQLAASWTGLPAGPLAWAMLLETNYVLSYVACEQRHTWMLHVAAAIALMVVGSARGRTLPRPSMPSDTRPRTPARARFMAIGGLRLARGSR